MTLCAPNLKPIGRPRFHQLGASCENAACCLVLCEMTFPHSPRTRAKFKRFAADTMSQGHPTLDIAATLSMK